MVRIIFTRCNRCQNSKARRKEQGRLRVQKRERTEGSAASGEEQWMARQAKRSPAAVHLILLSKSHHKRASKTGSVTDTAYQSHKRTKLL